MNDGRHGYLERDYQRGTYVNNAGVITPLTPMSLRWRSCKERAERLHDEVVILLLGKA